MPTNLDIYYPFDSGPGSNVTELQWRNMMRYVLSTGVIRGALNQHEVFADSTGMQVKVRTGQCWIQGHYGEQTVERTLTIAAAHASLARKDRVILRGDFVDNVIELDVLTGTAAASPVAPSLTQSASVWEISLAIVDVPATDTSIGSSQVVDDRTQYTSNANSPGELIAFTDLTTSAATVTFSSIPQTFRHLQLIIRGVYTAASLTPIRARFNGDTGANYDVQVLTGGGTTVSANRFLAQTSLEVGVLARNDIGATASSNEAIITNYTGKTRQKSVTARSAYMFNSGELVTWFGAGMWFATPAAITSVTLLPGSGSFGADTYVSLHGLN